MIRRRVLSLAAVPVVLALLAAGAAAGAAAGGAAGGATPGSDDGPRHRSAPHGSAGIGDPYFPLDGNGGINVISYDVHDRYRFDTGQLSGWTALRLRATQALSGFDLDFLLPVSAVTVEGRRARFDQHRYHELSITRALAAGQTVRVVVRYAGRPGDYTYAGESNWLADSGEVVAMNQPHMAPWWFPANDHPQDKARLTVSITVPRDLQVISNGRRTARVDRGNGLATTTWRSDEPMVPYLAFFAAGRYAVAQGRADGRPWLVAVSRSLPASSQQAAMGLMKRTPALLHWLETVIGPYPFSTSGGLTTALDPGFALENQTRPTYPFMGDGPGAVSTVVHELAHQWFGDSVAVHRWRDIWLNEGFATFMEQYYAETHGGSTARQWLRSYYDATDAGDGFWAHQVADPCPDHQGCVGPIFASFVYDRGAMALQALRDVIGDDDFFELLGTWAATRAGSTGSTERFEALAETVSGQDLDGFFEAWLHSPTKPADTAANGLG